MQLLNMCNTRHTCADAKGPPLKNQELTNEALSAASLQQALADLRALHGSEAIDAMLAAEPRFFSAALVADPDPGCAIPREGWTTLPDGAQTYYAPALSDAIEDGVRKALESRFSAVQPGRPAWYWFQFHPGLFEQEPQPEACRVVRDGSGGLWVDVAGQAERLVEGHALACLGPVAPYVKGAQRDEALQADAQETAAFAVYDALTLLLGEAGLGPRVAPSQMQEWAQRILASLLRADVGWAIMVLAQRKNPPTP